MGSRTITKRSIGDKTGALVGSGVAVGIAVGVTVDVGVGVSVGGKGVADGAKVAVASAWRSTMTSVVAVATCITGAAKVPQLAKSAAPASKIAQHRVRCIVERSHRQLIIPPVLFRFGKIFTNAAFATLSQIGFCYCRANTWQTNDERAGLVDRDKRSAG